MNANDTLPEKTLTQVQDILMHQLGVERAEITPEAGIMADLGADSLDVVEIGMQVEETFNVTIADEEMENIQTVGDLCEALANLLARTRQPL